MSRQSSNSRRQDRNRAIQIEQRKARRDFAGPRYWHGGAPGLEPGTILVNRVDAVQQGSDLTFYTDRPANDPTRDDRVYFTADRELARAFAADTRTVDVPTGIVYRHGDLYEVEPVGTVEPDPDFYRSACWCSPGARIIAVAERNVAMDRYETTGRAGPYLAWKDGSPVYSKNGAYLRSPEQLAAGIHHPMTQFLPPWTPLKSIESWLSGQPSDDRPDPSMHQGVLVRAAEAGPVLQEHYRRASKLTASGVIFAKVTNAQIDQINELLDGAAVLAHDDERGAVVATDARGEIVGAVVVTAMEVGNQVCMLIDTVKVARHWQRKGLGSVLLLTTQQILPRPPAFAGGHCHVSVTPFFAQLGFTVLRPGVPLFIPTGEREATPMSLSYEDECWFYRQGRF